MVRKCWVEARMLLQCSQEKAAWGGPIERSMSDHSDVVQRKGG